jgi:hypothetical protein
MIGCGGASSRAPLEAPGITAPPSALRDFVADRWPRGQIAAATAPCVPSATPAFVSGDFNGDGLTDIAARVSTPEGAHLVHAIARLGDFAFYAVPLDGDLATGQLGLRKRGEKYLPESGVSDYLGADTPTVTPCGQQPTAFFSTGSGIDPRRIGP